MDEASSTCIDCLDRASYARSLCKRCYKRRKTAGLDLPAPMRQSRPPRPCKYPGCDHPHESHGWCGGHARKWRQWGTPDGYVPADHAWDRFWAKVDIGHPLGCWWWTGAKNSKGYAQAKVLGRTTGAYRFSYEFFHGKIGIDPETGDPLEIDHLCRNRSCVNPDHLEPVIHAENIWRSSRYAGHEACRHGHLRVEHGAFNINGHQFCKECARIHQLRRPPRRRRAA